MLGEKTSSVILGYVKRTVVEAAMISFLGFSKEEPSLR